LDDLRALKARNRFTVSVVWTLSTDSTNEPVGALVTPSTLAPVVVFGAVVFNMVLCLVNTRLFGVGVNVVIAMEIALIGMALGLIWYRGYTLYRILLLLTAYFFAVMVFRSSFDPKIVRDFLIPIVFFFLGSYLGSFRSADRLVMLLIFLAFGAALFEWLALNTYLHLFDVIHYYIERGAGTNLPTDTGGLIIRGDKTAAGLFTNATRFEERTLLPFLGSHRVSGIFLEPVSVGNFGAIAFAWVLLRNRTRVWHLVAQLLAIATILVLADARFGLYLCLFTLVIYLVAPIIRPTMLFFAPFLMMVALVMLASASWLGYTNTTMAGRLLGAGESLASLDPWQVLGLQVGQVSGDSGYSYALVNVGLLGLAAIWALFVYAPTPNNDAWRFKNFIAFYIVFLVSISASLFTIKTAALLWFLYGTLNNQEGRQLRSVEALSVTLATQSHKEATAAPVHSPSPVRP
jgi:putative polymerase